MILLDDLLTIAVELRLMQPVLPAGAVLVVVGL
jgi:hypothetical protein